MRYKDFSELKNEVLKTDKPICCGVVMAEDCHTLEAVMTAFEDGLIIPVLIGRKKKIMSFFEEHSYKVLPEKIYDVSSRDEAMQLAVEMIRNDDIQCLMKGLIPTADFMKAIVKKENQLKNSRIISMLTFREIPNSEKLIAFTDAGICPHPDVDDKEAIINNAVSCMNSMGIDMPKVAVLAAAEEVNPKMPETEDAAELKRRNREGLIKDCIVEGPISLDLALEKEAAEIKGYHSPVAGDADLLVFPDLASANMTTKMIAHVLKTPAAVLILGTRVPVIVCSRAATTETKVLCITLAAAGGQNR